MPAEHRIDGQLVQFTVAGRMPIDELLGGLDAMVSDPGVPDGALVLIDVSASRILPSAHVVGEVADRLADGADRFGPRLAILVAHTVRFGIARQLSVMLESTGLECSPFFDRSEALEWLIEGVDPDSEKVAH